MKIYTSISKSILCLFITLMCQEVKAQDSTKSILQKPDTLNSKLNMDAVYNRPFLRSGKIPVAIGGYVEANTQYSSTDGITSGFNFQMRRMTLFFSSTIAKKIKFMSEMEFENGTQEINIETALVDIEFHPMLNLRSGIIINPIGGFNQNHDGPRWEFIDRPISASEIIPTTLSNVGFGFWGKHFQHNWIFGYEAYLTNGFDEKIIANELNRTSLNEGKHNEHKFEINHSGLPMFTGKVAIRNRKIGEIGMSYMSGVYNQWQSEGMQIDNKRSVNVFAIDFNTSLLKNRLNIVGEMAKVHVEVPVNFIQTYGTKQFGAFMDIIGTVYQHNILGWEKAKVIVGMRIEYADFNMDTFRTSRSKIYDELWAVTPCVSFRPFGTTVLRLNYKHQQQRDLVGNAPSKTGTIQFGLSTYF